MRIRMSGVVFLDKLTRIRKSISFSRGDICSTMTEKWQRLPPRSALLMAVKKGDTDVAAVKALLDQLAEERQNIDDIKDPDGTPLLQVAVLASPESVAVHHLLIEHGADPLLRDRTGKTALHAAAYVNNVDVLATLLLQGHDVNIRDTEGNTLLHLAVARKSMEVVEWLLFAGADPSFVNKEKKSARNCAPEKCFQLKTILRYPRVDEPEPYILNTKKCQSFTSAANNFSVEMMTSSSEVSHSTVMIRATKNEELHQHFRSRDGERFWGCGLEYLENSKLTLALTLPLHDTPDDFHELVLRVKEEREAELDAPVKVEDMAVENDVRNPVLDQCTVKNSPSTPTWVAKAIGRVSLRKTGHVGLVCRPITDTLVIGKGGGQVTSSVDRRVRVEAHVTEGPPPSEEPRLELQVEQSPPLSEPPHQEPETRTEGSLFDNPPVLLAMVQYFFRVTSPESFDEEMIKRIVSKTSLPLTEQFDKTKVAQVFTRKPDGGETSRSETEEIETEARRWSNSQVISLDGSSSSASVPTTLNRTTTVVQTSREAAPEAVKRAVAEQHIKSRQVPVRFHVHAQTTPVRDGETRHIGLFIKVKATAQPPFNVEGYQEVKATDVFYINYNTLFSISIKDTFQAECFNQSSAVIRFQHGIHTPEATASCAFMVQGHQRRVTKLKIHIERSKLNATGGGDKAPSWKPLTDIDCELPAESPPKDVNETAAEESEGGDDGVGVSESENGAPIPSKEELQPSVIDPFTDQFLMSLAREIPPTETTKLGIELLASVSKVDNVMLTNASEDMELKTFRILKRARESVHAGPEAFTRRLTSALERVQLNSVLQWLKEQLDEWEGFSKVWSHYTPLPDLSRRVQCSESNDVVHTSSTAETSGAVVSPPAS